MELILASTSPYRKQLMTQSGFKYEALSPEVDEAPYKNKGLLPQVLAETLAKLKSEAVANNLSEERRQRAIVIGSDQVACLDNQIFSKPGNMENAKKTLKSLAGNTHQLITSVSVSFNHHITTFTDVTRLKMRALSETEIENYLSQDEPYNCAGSYKLEQAGIKLFEHIQSDDFTAVQGLPMIQLCTHLKKIGYPVI